MLSVSILESMASGLLSGAGLEVVPSRAFCVLSLFRAVFRALVRLVEIRDGFSPLKLVLNWSFKLVLSVFSLKKLNRFKPVYKIIKNFFIDYPIKMYKQPDWLNVGSFFFNFSIENE